MKIRNFICWLKGHRWHVIRHEDRKGSAWIITEYFALDYCARCGEPSPATKPAVEGETT